MACACDFSSSMVRPGASGFVEHMIYKPSTNWSTAPREGPWRSVQYMFRRPIPGRCRGRRITTAPEPHDDRCAPSRRSPGLLRHHLTRPAASTAAASGASPGDQRLAAAASGASPGAGPGPSTRAGRSSQSLHKIIAARRHGGTHANGSTPATAVPAPSGPGSCRPGVPRGSNHRLIPAVVQSLRRSGREPGSSDGRGQHGRRPGSVGEHPAGAHASGRSAAWVRAYGRRSR